MTSVGCATYRQTPLEELSQRQPVRVRLAPEEFVRNVAFASGPQGLVGGRFVEARGDSVTLLLTTPTAFSQVTVHRNSILSLERKETSRRRSLLVSAAVVGGVAALAYLGFEGGSEGEPGPNDSDVDAFRPGVRLVLPVGFD